MTSKGLCKLWIGQLNAVERESRATQKSTVRCDVGSIDLPLKLQIWTVALELLGRLHFMGVTGRDIASQMCLKGCFY